MWVQRLRTSKPVIIALVVMMLVFSFQASRPQAVGLDTAVKIVAGSSAQKVVRAIGEKAGMAFTPKSLQATTDYINGQAAKGNQKYIDLAKNVNTVATAGTPHATKPGWKKYVLDPVLWLTGADLLVEAYDAFNDARTGGTSVDVYEDGYDEGGYYCVAGEKPVSYMTSASLRHVSDPSYNLWKHSINDTDGTISCDVDVTYNNTQAMVVMNIYVNGTYKLNSGTKYYNMPSDSPYRKTGGLLTRPASDDDVTNISNVTDYDTYKNTIDNDDYSKVTYDNDIEIYAPDTDTTYNNDYTTPWNTKMPEDEFTIIVQPITDIDIVVPGDDDDDLPTGKRPDPVETLDRSLLQVAKEAYGYFDDAIDSSVTSMKSVASGATGIVGFLDDSMDWLPAEWRAVFTATFMLGVFAHFFRR